MRASFSAWGSLHQSGQVVIAVVAVIAGSSRVRNRFASSTYVARYEPKRLLVPVFPLVRGRSVLVGDTGFEPVTSSVSGKRATAAPIARRYSIVAGPSMGTLRWVRDLNPCR